MATPGQRGGFDPKKYESEELYNYYTYDTTSMHYDS